MYDIILLKVNPTTHGMLIRRPRLYAVLLLKGRLQRLANVEQVYAGITNAFLATRPTPLSKHLVATPCELLNAENQARKSRRMSERAGTTDWFYLLSAKRQGYLQHYMSSWTRTRGSAPETCPGCIFDLSQNPLHRPMQTSSKGYLPTVLRAGLWWCPMQHRWLLPVEVASMTGQRVRDPTSRPT